MSSRPPRTSLLTSIAAAASLAFTVVAPLPALADHTAPPTSVTLAGSFQSELGCPDDWQPGCAAGLATIAVAGASSATIS